MSIIDHKLDMSLENMNLDTYELINLPVKQPGDSSHEHTALEWFPLWIQEVRQGWHPVKGVLLIPSFFLTCNSQPKESCVQNLSYMYGT